jgi:hypothetical protein
MKFLLSLVAAATAFAQFTMQPSGPPPAANALVDATGIQVAADGKVWCELWFAKSLPAGPKAAADGVTLPEIQHGAFLGIARFPAQAQDRRGNPIPAGVYAMRYSIHPLDGNHMGAAPQRDFIILIPAAKDKPPAEMLNYEALMALSRESTGLPHPAVLSLAPSAETSLPQLKKEDGHDWTLHIKIGATPVALIVAGRAES